MPTKKQKELLNFIEKFLATNDYSPSYREIMTALGYRSVSTVAEHINNLVAQNLLIKDESNPRSLTLSSAEDPHHAWFRTKYQELKSQNPNPTTLAAIEKTATAFDISL
ncbi:hypothetical protein FWD07_02080 [Candidatus Saccharibacteria bacterium]|nr:hypothetical protein [Candidatus Saccharibacteria bacterium]